jgi:hypothetical protein
MMFLLGFVIGLLVAVGVMGVLIMTATDNGDDES